MSTENEKKLTKKENIVKKILKKEYKLGRKKKRKMV